MSVSHVASAGQMNQEWTKTPDELFLKAETQSFLYGAPFKHFKDMIHQTILNAINAIANEAA